MKDGVNLIRCELADQYGTGNFVIDKSGCKVIEIIGASFLADEETIFGEVNKDYVERELEWYLSQSRSVHDIPGNTPKIWLDVADSNGMINSNYGWCIFSGENEFQFEAALDALLKDPNSRRSIMIYTRPSMQSDYNSNGMSDFICTNTVQYFIRDGKMNAVVNMRSNDVWAGYRNDYAWQKYVLEHMVLCYNHNTSREMIEMGDIHWCVGSLHLYEPQFYLLENWIDTGEIHCTKKQFEQRKANEQVD